MKVTTVGDYTYYTGVEVPEQFRDLLITLRGIGFIAGGAARSILVPGAPEPGDIDVFLYTPDLQGVAVEALEKLGYTPQGRQGSALLFVKKTLRWPEYSDPNYLPVQVIEPVGNRYVKTFGPPERVISQFGYRTEQAVIWADWVANWVDGERILGMATNEGIVDTARRELHINRITCPVALAWRAVKYGRKGYTIGLKEVLKLFAEWEQRPPEWKSVILQEELSDIDLYRLLSLD